MSDPNSLRNLLVILSPQERSTWAKSLSKEEALSVYHDWYGVWARPSVQRTDGTWTGQMPPPGKWRFWVILAGRGYGKTRSGAEYVRDMVEMQGKRRIALVGATAADVRDTMILGESGIIAISPPWNKPEYVASHRKLIWPNGAIATLYSAEKPRQLRGPQHDGAWADELAAWKYADAWDQLLLGLRLGDNPQVVVTTTPRPTPIIKKLVKRRKAVVTTGSTYENEANLAPEFIEDLVAEYEGTRLGLQEIHARILDDNPDALWRRDWIEQFRVNEVPSDLERVVVAIDPAVSSNKKSADTGIIVVGKKAGHAYILEDATCHEHPEVWARIAVAMYRKWNADAFVGEINNGGDLVERNIKALDDEEVRNMPFYAVHASRGKALRADPVATKYKIGQVHHVGVHAKLEDQQCEWTPEQEESPDRLDAAVWGVTFLFPTSPIRPHIVSIDDDDEPDVNGDENSHRIDRPRFEIIDDE